MRSILIRSKIIFLRIGIVVTAVGVDRAAKSQSRLDLKSGRHADA